MKSGCPEMLIYVVRSYFFSYDVASLFTNIPLNEAMDIICNYVYQQHSPPIYSRQTFKNFLQIAPGWYFLHGGKLCCKVYAVTMARPLGPTLTIFSLAYFENQFMIQKHVFMPKCNSRYVNDIFCFYL